MYLTSSDFSCNICECRMNVNLAVTFNFLKSYFSSFSFSLNIINSHVQLLLKAFTFTIYSSLSLGHISLTCDIGWRETQSRDPVHADTERKADFLVSIQV